MNEILSLSHGPMSCDIMPALGGSLVGLRLGDLPVLRPLPAQGIQSARQAASYPLVPFSNRIGHAQLVWQGTNHPLVRNNQDEPHAIHGVGWQRAWSVLESDTSSALLAYEHKADANWPFAFDSSQVFRLSDDTLDLTLSVTNQSSAAAPFGLGWHPYFVKRERSRLSFQATGRWEMGDDKLPTHRSPSRGIDADCAFLDVDHCFDGVRGDVHLRDERMHVRVRSDLSHLVVFTNNARSDIAIEPVSHVNNALALTERADAAQHGWTAQSLGLRVLQPGESLSVTMSINVQKA